MRKRRTPPPEDVSAEVLFASDNTCCICHQAERPVQIHHLDDDPANHANSNLAVLCLDCHNKTQMRGGFGRTYKASLVIRYRDDWLRSVAERRGTYNHTIVATSLPSQSMTREQARQLSQRLRTLYTTFFKGVGYLRDFAQQMGRRQPNENLSAREMRLKPIMENGWEMIDETLPELRIEPGSKQVCQLFESFRTAYNQHLAGIVYDHDHPEFFAGMIRTLYLANMDEMVDAIQAAIREHISIIDNLC